MDVAFFAVIVGRFVQRLDVDAAPEDHTSHGQLERPELGQAYADAAGELVRGQVSFMLQPGDCLIVNQRRFLHGQEALHSGQETVPVTDRRVLFQLSLCASSGDGSAT